MPRVRYASRNDLIRRPNDGGIVFGDRCDRRILLLFQLRFAHQFTGMSVIGSPTSRPDAVPRTRSMSARKPTR